LTTFILSTTQVICSTLPDMNRLTFLLALFFMLYTGMLFSQTASGPISYSGRSDLVIEGKAFVASTAAACIQLTNCRNIKIQNCTFTDIPSMIGVSINGSTNIEITNCRFYSFRGGVYAINSSSIKVTCNYFETIKGPKPRGQIVQFNSVTGGGNRINYNRSEHTLGDGNPEDIINLYGCSGIASDPIQIIGNHLRGGGPSSSGGGIMVGDNGGAYFLVADNVLVNPGQYGIAAPSGSYVTIQNNKVYASQQTFTNVGIYVGLQSEITAGYACVPSTIRVLNNQVNWTNRDGRKNGFYNCPCCSGITSTGNNFNSSINASILPAAFPAGVCPNPTLPIEGIHLSVHHQNGMDFIQWSVWGEIDVLYYILDRSTDGISFDSIQTISSRPSGIVQTYTTSAISTGQTHYYRIRYVSIDGSTGYSTVQSIITNKNQLTVFPLPMNEMGAQIVCPEPIVAVSMYKVDGALISTSISDGSSTTYFLPKPSTGGYYIVEVTGITTVYREKLYVE
jgi:hypothetical protein